MLQGDFGTSISLRQPVLDLVLGRLPATLELSIMALVIAVRSGGAAGADRHAAAAAPGPRPAIDVANGMALSIPDFLWGLVLILLFGVLWPVFHISGRVSPSLDLPISSPISTCSKALLRLRFDLWADLVGAHVHAGAGAGHPAGRDHRAAAEAIA